MTVKAMLKALHEGQRIILAQREGQDGQVDVDYLSIQRGSWVRTQLNCWSSQDVGLGTCRCQSHPAWRELRVSRKEVLGHLQTLAREEAKDAAERATETAWLETAIAECPD